MGLDGGSQRDMALLESVRAEVSSMEAQPTIEEVRAALSSIPGSVSEDVVAERGAY